MWLNFLLLYFISYFSNDHSQYFCLIRNRVTVFTAYLHGSFRRSSEWQHIKLNSFASPEKNDLNNKPGPKSQFWGMAALNLNIHCLSLLGLL